MKLLITGGAGFIGSHLAERLLRDGHQLAILDDLNDFYARSLKMSNLEAVRLAGDFGFHYGDICDPETVQQVIREEAPDAIVHLAARAGVRPSLCDPLLYEHVNVRGTMMLLEAARLAGIRRFVFASSSSVYGATNQVPFSEEDHLNLPVSPYAATKISGEKLCYTWSHLYGLRIVCLRFFTVYGPRQRPDLAIRKFTEMTARGEAVPMFGDGSSGRDYTYIDDIVDGIVAALSYDCAFEVFNLGNSHPVSLEAMIAAIESALGRTVAVRRLPAQPGDVPITYADISKAARLLGYCPHMAFSDGIRKFVSWYLHFHSQIFEKEAAV